MSAYAVYIAASYKHLHGVRLLGSRLRELGFGLLDWTEKATPPEGLSSSQRRAWMDTDHGGEVYKFCEQACKNADLLIYYGASGQDAAVEVGLAKAWGVPVLGIRGPLETPGLMLHGAVDVWVEDMDSALEIFEVLASSLRSGLHSGPRSGPLAEILAKLLQKYGQN